MLAQYVVWYYGVFGMRQWLVAAGVWGVEAVHILGAVARGCAPIRGGRSTMAEPLNRRATGGLVSAAPRFGMLAFGVCGGSARGGASGV